MFRALLCSSSGGYLYWYSIWYRYSIWVTVQFTGYEATPLVICVLNSHLKRVTTPDVTLIQFVLLKMSTIVLETFSGT